MDIVVDTNILFSLFWEKSFTRKILLTSPLNLISPKFALFELRKFKKEIILKTDINEKKFESYIRDIKSIVDFFDVNEDYKKEALKISPDKNDAEFIGLSLERKCPFWINDSLLKNQNKVKVFSTEEIINLL
jgi:predicted nucleic acid-binding protein